VRANGVRGSGYGYRMPDCSIVDSSGRPCSSTSEPGSPISLCALHLLTAYDWVSRDVGITDVLPSPCLACGSRLGVSYPSGWLCALCEWRVGVIPDGDLLQARVEVVYYLRFRDRIKIGTSGNPRARLAQLRFDELLAFERGGRSTEHRRHLQFASHRFEGSEWFRSHDELAAHISAVAAGTDDPWDAYGRWMSEAAALRS
jgi:hypothetical protein